MRILAWCVLLGALIFAGASNRLDDKAFEDNSSGGMSKAISGSGEAVSSATAIKASTKK
jgi:hypothetical protein